MIPVISWWGRALGALRTSSLLANCTMVKDVKLEQKRGGPPFSARDRAVKPESNLDIPIAGADETGRFAVITDSGRDAALSAAAGPSLRLPDTRATR